MTVDRERLMQALPEDLRQRIVSIAVDEAARTIIVIRRGLWLDGLELKIDDAIVAALGGHDGLILEEQPPHAADAAIVPTPPSRADERHFLTSRAWLALRYRVLKKYGARCQCCGRGARDGAIIQVDHIKPRSLYPRLALRADNLQVLCRDCNLGKGAGDATDWRPRRVTVEKRWRPERAP